jgi:dGTPase
MEAMTVRYGDRIAYLTHDALDALRAGVLSADDLPPRALERLGPPGRRWIEEMISAVIEHSLATGEVAMDPATLDVMIELRTFMFDRVYLSPEQRVHTDSAIAVIRHLVDHYIEHPTDLPDTYRDADASAIVQAVDHVAGMTDRFALLSHERLIGPVAEP